MSTGFLDFDIIGDTAGVQAMLRHLDTALSPVAMAGFLGVKVGTFLKERATARFKGEGDDVSGRWAPLQPSTQLVRSYGPWPVGPDSPINKRTGELEAYITQSDIYAWGHSMGATVMYPGKIPNSKGLQQKMQTAQQGRARPRTVKRPVLGVNERDLTEVMTMLAFHVQSYSSGVPVSAIP